MNGKSHLMNSPESLVRLFLPLFSTQSGLLTKTCTWMTWNLTFEESHLPITLLHFSKATPYIFLILSCTQELSPSINSGPSTSALCPISSSHVGFSFSLPGQHLIFCSLFPLPKICLHVEYNFTWSCLLPATLRHFLFSLIHGMSGLCSFSHQTFPQSGEEFDSQHPL